MFKTLGSVVPNCVAGEFQCDNFDCIPEEERCNGISECDDYTDEKNCYECKNGAFQ